MVAGINTVGSMGYVNPCDDYFGLYSNSGLNTGMTAGMTTGMTYPSIMNPGMYSIPQNLWNDPIGQMQYQYDMNNQYQGFNIRANAQQLTITDQCRVLAELISEGKEDEIMENFKELEATLKSQPQFAQCTDKEIKAYAQNMFAQSTGMSLTEAIKQNCKSNFSTGLSAGFFFGNGDTTSKEDLLAEINGTKKPTGASKGFGAVLGAIGGIVCLGIPALFGEHG